jgi:Na+-driven multidrug efflux pump
VSAYHALALPASLLVTQVVAVGMLGFQARAMRHERLDSDGGRLVGLGSAGSQAVATTVENIGFNASALVQQGIAGSLSSGAITMNAYATRMILVPITGMLQPIQQRLLIKFSTDSLARSVRILRIAAVAALGLGTVVGSLLFLIGTVAGSMLSPEWRVAFSEHRYPLVLFAYALYGGVVFTNQSMARFLFANKRGATYATVMVLAYGIGTAGRLWLTPRWGIVALPLAAIAAEGGAALAFLVTFTRGVREVPKPSAAETPLGGTG